MKPPNPSRWWHCAALCVVGAGTAANAQTPPPEPAPALAPVSSATSGPACAAATDKANAADLKAFGAQAAKAEPSQVLTLVDGAVAAWQSAVESCDARARERAQRNLVDSRQMRASLGESPAEAQQCESTQQDAGALQRLARQAVDERRWTDAAALFRKTEGLWDLAAERCSGSRRQAAAKLRDQAAVDGHNAPSCSPAFEKARQATERLRAASAALPPAERRQRSQAAEAVWRELAGQCQGGARDIALVQADLLLNEREPPWAVAGAAAAPLPTAPAVAVSPPSPAPDTLDVTLADKTRLQGRFTRDSEGASYSGVGRIEWANGDVYEGEVRHGLGHGRGEFTWPSGQTFKGDWVDGRAQGSGVMRFANGNLYEGVVADGVPAGSGSMVYANGDRYQGAFAAGLPHGEGVYTWKNGDRYAGDWRRGIKEGAGRMRWAGGEHFEGQFRAGVQVDPPQ